MKHYDVVVAGAGPSGATAAYYLAKQGKSVALIDRAKFPREKASVVVYVFISKNSIILYQIGMIF